MLIRRLFTKTLLTDDNMGELIFTQNIHTVLNKNPELKYLFMLDTLLLSGV